MNKITRGKPEPFPLSNHSELLIWAPADAAPSALGPDVEKDLDETEVPGHSPCLTHTVPAPPES